MKKEYIIESGYHKYCKVGPVAVHNDTNVKIDALLTYIGENRPHGNRTPIGSAYVEIMDRTNKLLGFSRRDLIMRTRKREVAAIRRYFLQNSTLSEPQYEAKIPFKLAWIFRAIVELVEEIQENNNSPLPASLKIYNDKSYRDAFYHEVYGAYRAVHQTFTIGTPSARLDGDFHGPVLTKSFP